MKKNFPVRPEKLAELYERMETLAVSESDLKERFIRCPGHGGQKVNKTSSGVHLVHLPSGTEIKCCSERTQSLNRFLARRLLLDRLETHANEAGSKVRERTLRIRKQKDRRKRRRNSATDSS